MCTLTSVEDGGLADLSTRLRNRADYNRAAKSAANAVRWRTVTCARIVVAVVMLQLAVVALIALLLAVDLIATFTAQRRYFDRCFVAAFNDHRCFRVKISNPVYCFSLISL
jgi:hypothetical protein